MPGTGSAIEMKGHSSEHMDALTSCFQLFTVSTWVGTEHIASHLLISSLPTPSLSPELPRKPHCKSGSRDQDRDGFIRNHHWRWPCLSPPRTLFLAPPTSAERPLPRPAAAQVLREASCQTALINYSFITPFFINQRHL